MKELEKSIKWLSNVNNFKNVSRYSKEYFEHFNKVVKALEQAQKQNELLTLSLELNNVWRNRFDYNNSESYIMLLEERIKYIEEEQKKELEK